MVNVLKVGESNKKSHPRRNNNEKTFVAWSWEKLRKNMLWEGKWMIKREQISYSRFSRSTRYRYVKRKREIIDEHRPLFIFLRMNRASSNWRPKRTKEEFIDVLSWVEQPAHCINLTISLSNRESNRPADCVGWKSLRSRSISEHTLQLQLSLSLLACLLSCVSFLTINYLIFRFIHDFTCFVGVSDTRFTLKIMFCSSIKTFSHYTDVKSEPTLPIRNGWWFHQKRREEKRRKI